MAAATLSAAVGYTEQTATIEVAPAVSLPLFPTPDLYEVGIGGALQLSYPFADSPLAAFARIGYSGLLLRSGAGAVNVVSAGGGVLYDLVGFGPVALGVEAAAGVYAALADGRALFNPSAYAGLRLGIGLGRGMELAVRPFYEFHAARRDGVVTAFWSGAGVSASVGLSPAQLSTGERRPRLEILPPRFDRVFPVVYKHYDTNPFGELVLRNNESAAVRNVKVEFFVPQYMAGPQMIGEFAEIGRGAELTVPITALFSNAVLGITEPDAVQSQISVSYDIAGQSARATRTATLSLLDRNTITWDDDRIAAAFISGRDPTVLRLARNVTAEAQNTGPAAINENFQKAMALFLAMEEHGIRYQVDPASSYQQLSQSESALDYLQFPSQTLDYRTGDCDDLTILYASLLESVAVPTAMLTIPGHLFMAFSLGMGEDEARSTFSSVNDLIFVDGQTWIPVETTLVGSGFLKAWSYAASQWREATERGVAEKISIASAQAVYAPTWFESAALDIPLPDARRVAARYSREMDQFVFREVEPIVAPLVARLQQSPSPRLENRVGTVYARYGQLQRAEEWFGRAARANYVPSIVNLGNLSYVQGDVQTALGHFGRAARLSPDDPDVLIGLARAQFDLEQYGEARANLELARALSPERAEAFAYITGGGSEESRASNAQRRTIVRWSE